MDLEYEPESTHLWAACDNNCGGRTATLDIAPAGPKAGHFVVTNTYERPAGMPDLNNEGFAIAPQAECVGGLKPVFWSDDTQLDRERAARRPADVHGARRGAGARSHRHGHSHGCDHPSGDAHDPAGTAEQAGAGLLRTATRRSGSR